MVFGPLDEEDEAPFKAGVEVNNAEAQVLRKDPRFRDWCKINMEDIETDITVGLDNLRREVKMVVKLCLSRRMQLRKSSPQLLVTKTRLQTLGK